MQKNQKNVIVSHSRCMS